MKTFKLCIIFFLSLPLIAGEWIDLFNGKDLRGWIKKGGVATYKVENGVILGTTKPKTENTFICPDEQFGDFELEFEVKCDPELNSGVQIRSSSLAKDIPAGVTKQQMKRAMRRVNEDSLFGPQVEIAANGNAGAIYFEGIGGWLIEPNVELTKNVYKINDWNHYRILAKGSQIKVWINGSKISDSLEQKTGMKSGFLGFQVHKVKTDLPLNVRWKNIKIRKIN